MVNIKEFTNALNNAAQRLDTDPSNLVCFAWPEFSQRKKRMIQIYAFENMDGDGFMFKGTEVRNFIGIQS